MSHTNTNVRSLRDQFQQQLQQQQVNPYGNILKSNSEQKHDILFQCVHCGRHQTVSLVFQSNVTKDVVHTQLSSQNSIEDIKRSVAAHRQVSSISENQEDETPTPLHRSNYALDFRRLTNENDSKTVIENNIKGLVDNCVRSSLNEISYANNEGETKDIVEVEVEYDPILGNVKSTRKRSSTVVTNLDNDYRSMNNRRPSNNNRYRTVSSDAEHDNTPIWARRRVSHSTVKPSDLIRENDKKEKLQAKALRRLSRADLAGDNVTLNSTVRPQISSQNPTKIKDTILRWCQDLTQYYKGINIQNFSSSWNNGLAFCAIIHRYFPDEFNFDTLSADEPRQNFDLAFNVAYERAGIEPLIDTDDMILMGSKPDWKVIFTYVQSLYRHLSRIQPPAVMRERW